ncbi:MAG: J domain-containing protein [Planctomycetaceae bacterium]
MRDPHEVLGVPWNADPRHIRAAYRKLVAELHPDRNPASDATDRLKEVVEAYRFLSNPTRFVRDEHGYDVPVKSTAATVSTAEFRRQQTFWYHFQKLIAPRESRWLPGHAVRSKIAVVFALGLGGVFLFASASIEMRNPNTLFDEVAILGLLFASTIAILDPDVFADIPVYTSRRGLSPSLPDWLVEAYGWIGQFAIAVIIGIGCRFFL